MVCWNRAVVFVGATSVAKVRSAELWSMVLLALGSVEASIAVKTAPTCLTTERVFVGATLVAKVRSYEPHSAARIAKSPFRGLNRG